MNQNIKIKSICHAELVSASHQYGFRIESGMTKYGHEQGRSMVEMLGVLAVIGILSVAGIAGYSNAMNKHRANELLNEASKRAVLVAAQAMTGKTGEISLGEFTQNTFSGVTFENTATVADNKITLTLSGSGLPDICDQLKNATGDNTVMKITQDDCSELTFNADMSKGVTLAPACTLNPTTDCASGALAEGKCECAPATNAQQCTSYTTNECGTGYFCLFSNPTDCDDNGQGSGICTEIAGDYVGYQNDSNHWYEKTYLNWYSANSWCIGKGRPGLLTCDGTGTGYSCTDDYVADKVDGTNVPGFKYAWLKNTEDSCYAFVVNLSTATVDTGNYRARSFNEYRYALCE